MNNCFLLAGLFFCLGCSYNRSGAKTDAEKSAADGFIKGVVNEIQTGKDGYTAKILTADGKTYFATISHSNLTNPAQYHSAESGDTLCVKGDPFSMNNENHVTVRELK